MKTLFIYNNENSKNENHMKINWNFLRKFRESYVEVFEKDYQISDSRFFDYSQRLSPSRKANQFQYEVEIASKLKMKFFVNVSNIKNFFFWIFLRFDSYICVTIASVEKIFVQFLRCWLIAMRHKMRVIMCPYFLDQN